EIDCLIEIFAGEIAVGPRCPDLAVEFTGIERARYGAPHDVLGKHVELLDERVFGVLRTFARGMFRSLAFEHLEAVRGHEHRLAGYIEPVIRPPDALKEAA